MIRTNNIRNLSEEEIYDDIEEEEIDGDFFTDDEEDADIGELNEEDEEELKKILSDMEDTQKDVESEKDRATAMNAALERMNLGQAKKSVEPVEYITSGRRSSKAMTYPEYVKVIGRRIDDLEHVSVKTYLKSSCKGFSIEDVAIQEIIEKRCPYNIMRDMGVVNGVRKIEVWEVNEMDLPVTIEGSSK
jgi:hypothetical protein